jgi:UDP-glucose 4-epimerase
MHIPKKYKRIFITGGAGFIGSHITDALVADKKDVIVFDNFSSGKKEFLKKSLGKKNLRIIRGDLLNPKQLAQALSANIDLVIHLAANPDISQGVKNPRLDFDQTINATFNLLQEMKNKGVQNLVYFSGSGVYGDVGSFFTKENHGPLLPISMYGASKLSAEALISAFSNLFCIQAWIVRPANIIGDRATHGVILDFLTRLKKNPHQLIILGDGNQSKSYLYISDVLSAVSLVLQKGRERVNLFNIASTSFITVNEIAACAVQSMGLTNVKIKHTKGNVGWPGDVPIVRIDSNKLRRIGWKEKYNSSMAVQKTIKDLFMMQK